MADRKRSEAWPAGRALIDPARAWPCSFRPQSVADAATTASPAPRHPPPRRTSRNRCCARAVVLVGRAAPSERARSGARPRLRPPVQRRGRVQGGSNSKIAKRSLQNRRRTDFRGRAMNPSILDRCVPGGSNCRAATRCRIYCRACAAAGAARVSPTNAPQPPRHQRAFRHIDLGAFSGRAAANGQAGTVWVNDARSTG